jgi:hypothetical protein
MRIALVFALILQAIALAGPVCGNHLTTAESMDCCEKGHNHDGSGMRDDHSTSCCSSCETGKTQILKRQEPIQPVVQASIFEIPSVEVPDDLSDQTVLLQHSVSPSPPDIFLLDRSLRI